MVRDTAQRERMVRDTAQRERMVRDTAQRERMVRDTAVQETHTGLTKLLQPYTQRYGGLYYVSNEEYNIMYNDQ